MAITTNCPCPSGRHWDTCRSDKSAAKKIKLKNRILNLTRNIIPYVKELQPLAGTVAGCIVMQQLDYWFDRKPDGFFKFMEPPQSNHELYRPGDSWVEELGMSAQEFRTAFDKIGTRHKSKTQFDEAKDKFDGKYYCSYQDRRANLTYYFRNHDEVDKALDAIIYSTNQVSTVNRESRVTVNPETRFTVNADTQLLEIKNPDLLEIQKVDLLNTEITLPDTTQIQLQQPQAKWPDSISPEEKAAISEMILPLGKNKEQQIIDELAGAMRARVIKQGKVPFVRGLANAVRNGTFCPNLGVSVLAERNLKQTEKFERSKFIKPVITAGTLAAAYLGQREANV